MKNLPFIVTQKSLSRFKELREIGGSFWLFPIIEIQTDNDTAFTDKFSSGRGVSGDHGFGRLYNKNEIKLLRFIF